MATNFDRLPQEIKDSLAKDIQDIKGPMKCPSARAVDTVYRIVNTLEQFLDSSAVQFSTITEHDGAILLVVQSLVLYRKIEFLITQDGLHVSVITSDGYECVNHMFEGIEECQRLAKWVTDKE